MTTKLLLILFLATIFLSQNIKGQKIESNVDQGNLSRGVTNCLGLLSGSVRQMRATFSETVFQYFNLKNGNSLSSNIP